MRRSEISQEQAECVEKAEAWLKWLLGEMKNSQAGMVWGASYKGQMRAEGEDPAQTVG